MDDQVVDAAHCVDISEPKTVRGLIPDYRLYTARRTLSRSAAHPPAAAHGRTRPVPAATTRHRRPQHAPAAPGAGEWDIPRVPLCCDRAVIAPTMLAAQPRTARAMYDVTNPRQAAMPEQLLGLVLVLVVNRVQPA
ncbi:hypothetical protein ACFWWA_35325 [Streptomyces goshikiensis]|uniref:hypothetical protein n=1 Tax=Streptomyces goshikiensis TaxID=1942 RepID=UPI003665BE21